MPPSAAPSAPATRPFRAFSGVNARIHRRLRFRRAQFFWLCFAAVFRGNLRTRSLVHFSAAIFRFAMRLRTRCRRRCHFRNRCAQSRERLCRFLTPVRAPETLRCNCVPAHRLFAAPGFFLDRARLERHHRIPRFLKQFVQFRRGIRARARPAYSSLYLPPISHARDCISANARNASARGEFASAPRKK